MTEIRKTLGALVLVALVAGAAACGGEANGSSSEMSEQAGQMADQAKQTAGEMTEKAGEMTEKAGEDMQEAGEEMQEQELPDGVTKAMIAEGDKVFHGAGICTSCHGPQGKGIPNLGANLTDSEWLHNDGSYQGILHTVETGVTAQESTSGVPMPAKGGSNISQDQVKAVAAYVWSLSHGG